MKAVSTINFTIMAIIIFLSWFYLSYCFFLYFFHSSFAAKPSGPDDFYYGIKTLFNALPIVLFVTVAITALILLFLKNNLGFVTAVCLLLVSSVFILPTVYKNYMKSSVDTEVTKLLKLADEQYYKLLSTVPEMSEPFERTETIEQIELLVSKNKIGAPYILGSPMFRSAYNYICQQGFKVTNTDTLYVTPVLYDLLFQDLKSEELKSFEFQIKRWSLNDGAIPYLKVVNLVSLEQAGLLATAIYIKVMNTNYPMQEIVLTIPHTPKDLSKAEKLGFKKVEFSVNPLQDIYVNEAFPKLNTVVQFHLFDYLAFINIKELTSNETIASDYYSNFR